MSARPGIASADHRQDLYSEVCNHATLKIITWGLFNLFVCNRFGYGSGR